MISLSANAKTEFAWWSTSIPSSFNYIEQSVVDTVFHSEVSLYGWGAVLGNISKMYQWSPEEATHHITYLELLAAYFALKSFSHPCVEKHVQIMIDNTIAVGVINNMGTCCHSESCNAIA